MGVASKGDAGPGKNRGEYKKRQRAGELGKKKRRNKRGVEPETIKKIAGKKH